MDDKLERFIKSHRQEMDAKEPSPDLWLDIANEISIEKVQIKRSRYQYVWKAAAVILLLITSWLVIDKVSLHQETPQVVINPQLEEAENFYFTLIENQRNEVLELSRENGLDLNFTEELNTLDSMYSVLKEDMANGNEASLVDAMILNLQLRIEILNQQLSIIKSIEESKKENNIEDETINL